MHNDDTLNRRLVFRANKGNLRIFDHEDRKSTTRVWHFWNFSLWICLDCFPLTGWIAFVWEP